MGCAKTLPAPVKSTDNNSDRSGLGKLNMCRDGIRRNDWEPMLMARSLAAGQ